MVVPVVSVIVPVLDDAARLQACLDALAAAAEPPSFEIIVVDNGSSDASVAVARAHRLGPLLVHEPRRGSYAARNAGAARASGRVLAFTDADCVPAPDWLARGVAAVDEVGVVGGRIVALCSPVPTVWELYDGAVYLRQAELVAHGFAATANLWLRRSTWDEVGAFDDGLLSSGDLEWGRRARAAGHPAHYRPEVVVSHATRSTWGQTWALHRRLGAGWAVLRRRGQWPGLQPDRSWRLRLGAVVEQSAPGARRRHLAAPHVVAMTARLTGLLTARESYRTRRRARAEP